MSRMRPELVDAKPGAPCLYGRTAFRRVFEAVRTRRRLLHGRLRDPKTGMTCAVGAYFDDCSIALHSGVIDQIATYNDSFPLLTPHQRWRKVRAWLQTKATE